MPANSGMDRATLPLRLHSILDEYRGIHLNGLSIQDVGPVFPFLHGFDGRLDQHCVAFNGIHLCNVPLLINDDPKKHISSDGILPSLRGIDRVHVVAKLLFGHS